MMRKPDVSRLLPDPNQESAQTGTQPSRCDAAVERATALLIHGMQQSHTPIAELGSALARMARTLGEVGTPLFGAASASEPQVDIEALCGSLARDIAVCIQSLQFHDRLMQQLSQARDLLTAHVTNGLLAHTSGPPANEGNIEGSVELF